MRRYTTQRTIAVTGLLARHLRARGTSPEAVARQADAAWGVVNVPAKGRWPEIVIRLDPLMLDVDELELAPCIRWRGNPHHLLMVDNPGVLHEKPAVGVDAGRVTGIPELDRHRIESIVPGRSGGLVIELETHDESIRLAGDWPPTS